MIDRPTPLAYLATFINGRAFKPDDFTADGLPVIRIRQLLNPEAIVDCYDGPYRPQHLLSHNDLVFSWSGTLAVRLWDRGPALLNQHLFRVLQRPEINRRWLRWGIEASLVHLKPLMHGSAMTHITKRMLHEVKLQVPAASEQEATATELDAEVGTIDHALAELESLSALLSLRTRANTAERVDRFPASSRTMPLRAFLRPRRVNDMPDLEVLSVFREYGVIPKASRDGNYNRTPDDLTKYQLVEPGDVVVNKMKAWQGSLGVSAFRGIVSPDYLVCEVIRPIDGPYLHAFLRSPQMIAEYVKRSKGIRPAQWRLYWEDFKEIYIRVPASKLQIPFGREIASERTTELSALEHVEEQTDLLSERRDALITGAVSAEVDDKLLAA